MGRARSPEGLGHIARSTSSTWFLPGKNLLPPSSAPLRDGQLGVGRGRERQDTIREGFLEEES